MTDIEAINARYNHEIVYRGLKGIESLIGMAQRDGSRVLLYLDYMNGESIAMTRVEAMSLGAALLTITKETGETDG